MPDESFSALVEPPLRGALSFRAQLGEESCRRGRPHPADVLCLGHQGTDPARCGEGENLALYHAYREFLRVRRRGGRISALEDLPGGEQDVPAADVDIVAKMDAQLVLAALQEVDLAFREPLTLFYLQDLSYTEIAEILSVPIGTVMSRLSRGKVDLRARLAEKSKGGNVIDFPKTSIRA